MLIIINDAFFKNNILSLWKFLTSKKHITHHFIHRYLFIKSLIKTKKIKPWKTEGNL